MKPNPLKHMELRLAAIGLTVLALCAYSISPSPQSVSADGVEVTGGAPVALAALAADHSTASSANTATPIKHLVVVFQENSSFDHYFATYPHALNLPGETQFTAKRDTPRANTLESAGLLTPNNPNSVQPFRLSPSRAETCSMNHNYTPEQQAYDGGRLDRFVQFTEGTTTNPRQYCPTGIVMSYFDGNTVTALWNYAQNFAMNDNSFSTTFGPSAPGALELAAGDTAGAACGDKNVFQPPAACSPATPPVTTIPVGNTGTVINDPDQYYDDWSKGGFGSANTAALVTPNIGERLSAAGLTWGWFNGGFDTPAKHPHVAYDRFMGIDPATDTDLRDDYSAHHEPFQYFASTANPHHLTPSSPGLIGQTDRANHQYDLADFWTAADAGNLPAVSFLKAPQYQDGHPGYSDPLDEQEYLVSTINHLMSLASWKSTAIVIGWDDSDGWYDHVKGPIVNHSSTSTDTPMCGPGTDGQPARCGYGQRLPYLVISPYARTNYVDHTLTDQTSTLRFIEDNWLGAHRLSSESFDNRAGSILGMFDFDHPGRQLNRLYLDPVTGQPLPSEGAFEVRFTSAQAGQGRVYFGSGPECTGLVEVATRDAGAGTTTHRVLVTGNDLPGTVGDNGIVPGTTYWYEAVTVTPRGEQIDNNGGKCYSVTIPRQEKD